MTSGPLCSGTAICSVGLADWVRCWQYGLLLPGDEMLQREGYFALGPCGAVIFISVVGPVLGCVGGCSPSCAENPALFSWRCLWRSRKLFRNLLS
jgi:hypothetical protein